jgi:hypothetical protein
MLTPNQMKQLEKLWFIYGNNGKKSSLRLHKFLQGFIEHSCDYRNFYRPEADQYGNELLELVDKILA